MANDRYRYDQDRYRDRNIGERDWRDRNETFFNRERQSDYGGRDRGDDDGYIARRGFGNDRSGYDRGRERDFGDSAGYGSGGSALDWRDVVGEERVRGRSVSGSDDDRSREWGYPRSGSSHGRDQDRYGYGREQDRYGSTSFGRGSRDYGDDRGFFERAGDEIRSWFGDDEAERRRDRDMREGQHHRGRGPRGYQRSDARIMEDVNDRLTDDPHIDASNIEVTVSNREVTLIGTVNSRFEKRHAEDLAESVSGVSHVQNNLRIQQYADAGMGGSMLSGAGAAGAGTTGTPETNTPGTTDATTGTPSTDPGGTGTTRKRMSRTSGT